MPQNVTAKLPRDPSDPYRHGIYLRPDARTCRAVTVVTDQLRAQYGLLSAGAFPPHATLVGSQPFGSNEDQVVAAVTALLDGRPAFDVHNAGVREQGIGFVYDVATRPDGSHNDDFVRLAADIEAVVAPFRQPMQVPLANDYDPEQYRAHLSSPRTTCTAGRTCTTRSVRSSASSTSTCRPGSAATPSCSTAPRARTGPVAGGRR